MIIFRYLLTAFLSLLLLSDCRKIIDPGSPDRITSEQLFSTDSLVQSYMVDVYTQMMADKQSIFNGGITWLTSLSSDELIPNGLTDDEDFFTNSLWAGNPILEDTLWKKNYKYIYVCNDLITGLSKPNGITPTLKTRILGEAKFMRAFCYYYFINLFGDVPLVLSTDYSASASIGHTPASKVYEQIVDDLKSADSLLTNNQPNTFAGKLASEALLARVYLHLQKGAEAEHYSSLVINSRNYQLENNLDSVFVSSSKETIFQLEPIHSPYNTIEGYLFIPNSATQIPVYTLQPDLVNSFEPADQRKTHWLKALNASGTNYTIPFKYKIGNSSSLSNEYNIVLRLAEQYLIRAEARAMQINLNGAIEDLNKIRIRAGLPSIATVLSLDECKMAIEKERRSELFVEWGHRWFDLKRTGRADAVLSAVKGSNWQSTDQLYPIPSRELNLSSKLVQNPGYN